jgi:hypothetical protein
MTGAGSGAGGATCGAGTAALAATTCATGRGRTGASSRAGLVSVRDSPTTSRTTRSTTTCRLSSAGGAMARSCAGAGSAGTGSGRAWTAGTDVAAAAGSVGRDGGGSTSACGAAARDAGSPVLGWSPIGDDVAGMSGAELAGSVTGTGGCSRTGAGVGMATGSGGTAAATGRGPMSVGTGWIAGRLVRGRGAGAIRSTSISPGQPASSPGLFPGSKSERGRGRSAGVCPTANDPSARR